MKHPVNGYPVATSSKLMQGAPPGDTQHSWTLVEMAQQSESFRGGSGQQYPNISTAASRLLSAHVTSCSLGWNWSHFGTYSKARNCLALKRTPSFAFIRSNCSSRDGAADEKVMLPIADLQQEVQEVDKHDAGGCL